MAAKRILKCLENIYKFIIDVLFPRRCPFCDQVLGSVPTCPDCAAELEELRRKPGMRLA